MKRRGKVEQGLKKFYLDGVARELLRISRRVLWYFKRHFIRINNRIIERYFGTHEIRKLHIGCGDHILDGWLNADLLPQSATILHLDTTKPFPFGNEKFHYIFSEHLIEHLSYPQGLHMLSECYRVLRGDGKIRISTPNLAFLIDLYKEKKSHLQREYMKWSAEQYRKFIPCCDDVVIINNFVRNWGHQFIYDEKELSESLKEAGFTKITKCELNKSEDEALRNLENVKRMPEGFLRLETITLEGTKLPAG